MASQMLVTPKGSATWPKLWTPDVKFNAHGEYKIGLKIKEDLAEDLTNEITRQVDAVYASELKKNPKLQGKMTKRLPFETVLDDSGNETGLVEFKFKCKALVQKKDGDTFTQKPAVYDSKGKPILEAIENMGNGSVCKVAFETIPYLLASTKQASVSLRLKSVQILELREYSNESNPFSEEEGYQFEEDTSPFAEKTTAESASDFSEEDDQDF
tara:strand:+ start:845 stop:1483 length:639 start_codon:yes stop_codon:yes gene_type:complete